ncbi:hypothetical protein FALBO_12880 [Fusarium albosuccineum]|uniref:Uncharacterized protein n=1 Tax=Fusarium albosuccineum TaxID=1237068 RepID=A0A8H4L1K7_9HYPO|nr:hypothetical protein FALBO_12880 [Fusarium albosuccineum]
MCTAAQGKHPQIPTALPKPQRHTAIPQNIIFIERWLDLETQGVKPQDRSPVTAGTRPQVPEPFQGTSESLPAPLKKSVWSRRCLISFLSLAAGVTPALALAATSRAASIHTEHLGTVYPFQDPESRCWSLCLSNPHRFHPLDFIQPPGSSPHPLQHRSRLPGLPLGPLKPPASHLSQCLEMEAWNVLPLLEQAGHVRTWIPRKETMVPAPKPVENGSSSTMLRQFGSHGSRGKESLV